MQSPVINLSLQPNLIPLPNWKPDDQNLSDIIRLSAKTILWPLNDPIAEERQRMSALPSVYDIIGKKNKWKMNKKRK